MIFYRDGKHFPFENVFSGGIFLLCNGPSRNNYNLDLLNQPGIMTMTVNNGGHSFRSNFWVGEDSPIKFMDDIWLDPRIMKFTSMKHHTEKFFDTHTGRESQLTVEKCPNVFFHEKKTISDLSNWLDGKSVKWNTTIACGTNVRSVMLSALSIIYILGFRKVYILGADFEMTPEKKYCFEQERTHSSIIHNNTLFQALRLFFILKDQEFKEKGFLLYNCGKESKLDSIPYKDFVEAVNENKIDINSSTLGMYERSK